MSAKERTKGARGEREVVRLLLEHLPSERVQRFGGGTVQLSGDITGVDGYYIEVKRQETLRLPLWLRIAADECGDGVPVVAFRQNRGQWFAALPLRDLARLLAVAKTASDERARAITAETRLIRERWGTLH